jgi:hypothetical protein
VFRQAAAGERHKDHRQDRRCYDDGGSELGCYHASPEREGTARRTTNNRKLGPWHVEELAETDQHDDRRQG